MTALICTLLLAGPPREALLEGFDSTAGWTDGPASPAAAVVTRDGGSALRFDADFAASTEPRIYHDKQVSWDLRPWGRFTIDVFVEKPAVFGHLTIYLQSGDGWYAAQISLDHVGWKTINLPRAAFGTEGTPAGWDQIRTIRVSPWRGSKAAGYLMVDNLRGYREEIALVVGTHAFGGPEGRSVQSYAESMATLLEQLGILTGSVTDEEVEQGALAGRRLAILPYNPAVSEAEAAALRAFVNGGGKLLAFYSAGPLAELFGLQNVRHVRAEYDGQFHAVDLDTNAAPGLPAAIVQDSWNINAVDPAPGDTVIGWWRDRNGQRVPYPALVRSPAGVWMAHVLTEGDDAAKQRMLLALLGQAVPEVWTKVLAAAVPGPERVGHVAGVDAAREWIRAQGQAESLALLRDERLLRETARSTQAGGRPVAALEAAQQADLALREAYLRAIPPKPGEWRALWNHSGTGAHGDWAESVRNLKAAGFNAIVPNMLWGGVAHYASDVLPRSATFEREGDQIAECLAAAKPAGIEVHVWKVNWNLGAAPPEFVAELRRAGRLHVERDGAPLDWLCPSNPLNLQLEVDSMVEVARKYAVDGVHFDYIRYPHGDACFCDGCRERFQRETGIAVANWPDGALTPEVRPRWNEWRRGNITRLVKQVAEEVRRVRPGCKISAAVFGDWPFCRDSVAQDWLYWIEQGWLDFVCPMDYTNSDSQFEAWTRMQLEAVAGRVPVYPGIGATASSSSLAPDRVAGQILLARQAGAPGFIIFNYASTVAADLLPALALGPTRP